MEVLAKFVTRALCWLLAGAAVAQAEPVPLISAEATFQGSFGGDLARVIDDIEAGPQGWSVDPKFLETQSLIVRCAKPEELEELDITLYFLSGRPNESIAEFDLAYTTDAEPSLSGKWEPLAIERYAAEVANLSRLTNGHLRSSPGVVGINGVIPDDTYRLVARMPRGRATGFRLRAFPLLNAKGIPHGLSWSVRHNFVLTEFRIAKHIRSTTNIALHCRATSSHALEGMMTPLALTDGLPATIAHPLKAHHGAEFHFDIDLGKSAAFDHINLRGRGDTWVERLSRVLVSVYENDPESGAAPVWEGMDRADGSHPGPGEHDVIRAGLGEGAFRGRYLRLSSDSPVPLSPQLAEVEVYESRTPEVVSALADGLRIPVIGELSLPPGVRRLSLQLKIPQTGMPTGDVVRWRVLGDMEKWQTSRFLTIEMPCPPPGKTSFEVQAMHSDHEWDATVLSLPIIAREHFWQSRVFKAIFGTTTLVGAVLMTIILSKRRTARQLASAKAQTALAEERTRIARDLHDDLGGNLARIGFLTEIVGRSMEDPEHARLQLEKIYTTAEDLTRQLRTVVWAVDPVNDTLESFARYLHGHAEDYLGMAGIRCHFTSTEVMPEIHLPSPIRHPLLMIAKEALHNVVKHAAATVVTFRIVVEDQRLIIEIVDNGRGMPPTEVLKPGHGLANMRARAAAIGATCEILPAVTGAGTLVRFILPLGHKLGQLR
jgi:signal transduction histidine kinase